MNYATHFLPHDASIYQLGLLENQLEIFTNHPQLDHFRIETYGFGDATFAQTFIWTFWSGVANSQLLSILKYNVAGIVQPLKKPAFTSPVAHRMKNKACLTFFRMKISPLASSNHCFFVVTVSTSHVYHRCHPVLWKISSKTVHSSGPTSHRIHLKCQIPSFVHGETKTRRNWDIIWVNK